MDTGIIILLQTALMAIWIITLPIQPPDQCQWSAWSIWTACADPCSGGVRQRYRWPLAAPPAPRCKSQQTQSQSCNTGLCPGENIITIIIIIIIVFLIFIIIFIPALPASSLSLLSLAVLVLSSSSSSSSLHYLLLLVAKYYYYITQNIFNSNILTGHR